MEQLIIDDDEPFMLRERTPDEIADFDAGFKAGSEGKGPDDDRSLAWALKEWLGHRRLASTQWYAAITPDRLTQAYVDTRYFERNVAVVQVLFGSCRDREWGVRQGRSIQICPSWAWLLCESLLGAVPASNGLPAL
jgi:hypothetical protein